MVTQLLHVGGEEQTQFAGHTDVNEQDPLDKVYPALHVRQVVAVRQVWQFEVHAKELCDQYRIKFYQHTLGYSDPGNIRLGMS